MEIRYSLNGAITVATRGLCAVLLIGATGCALAQSSYPTRAIRFVIPFPPGGSSDPMARLIGQKLTEAWGQPVIADNRPGGNTIIATEAVAKAVPDGYTVLMTPTGTFVTTPLLMTTPYDVVRDFAPVAAFASSEWILVVHPALPANDLKSLIALAKSKPGAMNYASAGTGNPNHLAAELLNMLTGARLQHIPYKGSGPALADLLGGQVHLHFATPIAVTGLINGGKLKAMAVSGEARLPALPKVPTFAEAGLPGFDMRVVYGFVVPAATPRDVVNKLSAEIVRIVGLPDYREKISTQGLDPTAGGAEQFAAIIKADTAKFARVIKAANIRLEK